MVVYLHAYNAAQGTTIHNSSLSVNYNSFIQIFISQGLTRIAVPLFFAISGYLFFLNVKTGSFVEIIPKIKKRFKTLLLPYLIWSALSILLFTLIQTVPQLRFFFNDSLIVEKSLIKILNNFFFHPIPYQLWFIRDLLLLVCISPFLHWLLKNHYTFIIFLLLVLWFMNFNYHMISNESILFYSFGGFLAIKKLNVSTKFPIKGILFLTFGWILILIFKTVLTIDNTISELILIALHKISILVGVVSFWFLYDVIMNGRNIAENNLTSIFTFSFFLYLIHEPLLTILEKISLAFFGKSQDILFFTYLLIPIIVVFLALFIGNLLKSKTPLFYNLITGAR